MSETLTAGWGWVEGSDRGHYFGEDGRSLCQRWSNPPQLFPGLHPGDHCTRCLHRREMATIEAERDALKRRAERAEERAEVNKAMYALSQRTYEKYVADTRDLVNDYVGTIKELQDRVAELEAKLASKNEPCPSCGSRMTLVAVEQGEPTARRACRNCGHDWDLEARTDLDTLKAMLERRGIEFDIDQGTDPQHEDDTVLRVLLDNEGSQVEMHFEPGSRVLRAFWACMESHFE